MTSDEVMKSRWWICASVCVGENCD